MYVCIPVYAPILYTTAMKTHAPRGGKTLAPAEYKYNIILHPQSRAGKPIFYTPRESDSLFIYTSSYIFYVTI